MRRRKAHTMTEASRKASSDACISTQRLARAASSLGHIVDNSDGIPIEPLDDDDSTVVALDIVIGRTPSGTRPKIH